jgi:multiple sugar transport system substrate-binding protein
MFLKFFLGEEDIMKKVRFVLAAALALFLALIPAFAGGGGQSGGGTASISFMGWGSPSEQEIFKQMIADFQKANPGVKVQYNGMPSDDFVVKLQAMVAGRNLPDAFYLPGDSFMAWVSAGQLLDLTPYIEKSPAFDVKNVWPAAVNLYRYDGNRTGQGNIYALPKDVGPWALAYNKTMLQQKGIPLPDKDKPWTFDEFVKYGQTLTGGSGTNQTWAVGNYTGEAAIWANGADWLDSTKTKVTINTPEFIEAMQWRADLINKHRIHMSPEDESSLGAYQRWLNGQIAFMGMGPWDQPAFWELPFEWDLMPWPAGRSGKSATWLGSLGLAVSPATKHPQAAFDLIAYFAVSEAGQRTNYQMGQAVPNIISMAKGEFLQMNKAPANRQEFLDIIENYGRFQPMLYTYDDEWWTTFWSEANNVWLGKISAAQFCQEQQPKIQALLDNAVAKQQAAKKK